MTRDREDFTENIEAAVDLFAEYDEYLAVIGAGIELYDEEGDKWIGDVLNVQTEQVVDSDGEPVGPSGSVWVSAGEYDFEVEYGPYPPYMRVTRDVPGNVTSHNVDTIEVHTDA